MSPRKFTIAAVAAFLTLPLLALSADARDPAIGIWKLDISKSTLHDPAPKSEIRNYEIVADGATKLTVTYEDADGTKGSSELTYLLNGKDYPVKDVPGYDAVAATVVDQYTIRFDIKKGGKTVGSFKRTVSPDGKTLTALSQTTAPDGKTYTETAVYARQ
jgi:hypothetical protein